jgi:hypothetical protein
MKSVDWITFTSLDICCSAWRVPVIQGLAWLQTRYNIHYCPHITKCVQAVLIIWPCSSTSVAVQRVYRNGKVVSVGQTLLVEGDIILMNPGEEAPSDCISVSPFISLFLDSCIYFRLKYRFFCPFTSIFKSFHFNWILYLINYRLLNLLNLWNA